MTPQKNTVFTINSGSSSLKFALYEIESLKLILNGSLLNIGTNNATIIYNNYAEKTKSSLPVNQPDTELTIKNFTGWVLKQKFVSTIACMGHRIVQGMKFSKPELITDEVLEYLKSIIGYDPEHLPSEIKLIEYFKRSFPLIPQIACFDTYFHNSMPSVATLLPIPEKFRKQGIHRNGFHGLSYSYLMEELEQRHGKEIKTKRIILAHLGNGASIAAVRDGKSMDTSMGFSSASGLPMSSRSGDLDPGVAWVMMKTDKMNPDEFYRMINHESGLLAIAQISGDLNVLLSLQRENKDAAKAVEFFCYHARKCIGSLTAVLGGLDMLVFTGGVGEHLPEIRSRICKDLHFLGIEINENRNANNNSIISKEDVKVLIQVIPTNEEYMIAKYSSQVYSSSQLINAV